MKRFLGIVCLVFMSLFILGSVGFAADITLKLGHIADSQNPYAQGGQKFADLVSEKSGGSVEIQLFPNNQLGNQRDLVEGLTFGTVDMCFSSTAVLGNFLEKMAIFDFPFIFRNREHTYKALDTVGMDIAKELEPRGIKVLAFFENGVRNMTNDIRPIRNPEDMKGMKIRVMEQPVYISMMKILGANPTPMAFGELYTALQQGTIDGEENPAAHIYTKRFFEVQKYISLTAHTYSAEPLLISMIAWNKLNPDQQRIFQEAASESKDWQRKLAQDLESNYWDKIRQSGKSEINEDVDREAFKKATLPVWKEFENKVGKENIEAIVNIK